MLELAKHFGQLPDTIEKEMSEYWRNRAWEKIQGEYLAENESAAELKKKRK